MKKATAVVLVLLLAGCSSPDDAAKPDNGLSVNDINSPQNDSTDTPPEVEPSISAGAAPELARAGLYNEVTIANNSQVAPDCVSQSIAFADTYDEPQFVNHFYDETPDDATGDVIEFNYQCTLRVISFTELPSNGQCAITGMNVTPEHWGHNPYELIEGC